MLKDVDASDEHSFAHERVWDSSLNTLSMDETDAANHTAGDDATSEPHFVLEKDLDSFFFSVVALSTRCDSILAVV